MTHLPRTRPSRRGTILVLSAFLMIAMMAMVAMAIDLGVILVAKEESQRCADSAAIAAAWEFVSNEGLTSGGYDPLANTNARTRASEYANKNAILLSNPALATSDVEVGYMANPTNSSQTLDTSGAMPSNAVRVIVRRTTAQNGEIPMFFGRLMGLTSAPVQAEATAALLTSFNGFQAPSGGGNLNILPFALDQTTWDNMIHSHIGTDNWKWDALNERVIAGADGILEVNLFPQGTGSPGNRGTVDIGSSNNSTSDIARQITYGVSPSDLNYHGGKLEFNSQGKLHLNGDTGISAGVKDELAAIIGEPRMIPIFTTVNGPGNNAQYTIVRFVGIRITDVKLTGSASSKRVIVQPANVVTKGGIPGGNANSTFVYSPVRLVR